jgi:hypothetical protein
MKARKKLTLALAGAVATLALASIGWAAIPDSAGVIHGCYKKDNGALRVYDDTTNSPKKCTDKETALDWNQQGGFSEAYINYSVGLSVLTDAPYPGTVVTSRSLPPGSYVFIANLVLKGYLNSYPSNTTACQLVAHDNLTDHDYWANGRGTYPADGVTPLGLSVAYSFGADGGTLSLRCVSPVQAQVESVNLTALSVGQIHY